MIKTFADQATADLFAGKRVARWANIQIVATRKLQQLDSATTLDSLRVPPGNRLEALSGDRKGQHSIAHQRAMAPVLRVARRGRAGGRDRGLSLNKERKRP